MNHFSWWNCDIGIESPLIKGKVVDCNGIAVPNIVVTVNGWATTLTNQNGEWQGQVPAGIVLTVQVLMSNNNGITLNSQLENTPALLANQTFIVPDLVIPCPTRISGTIKNCSGENTDGFIFITDNSNFNNYQYTINGSFNLVSIENAQLDLNAYNLIGGNYQVITTPSAPDTLNVGNIELCDIFLNNFTLNGNQFSNQLFTIVPTTAIAQIESTYTFYVTLAGTALPGFTIQSLNIALNDSLPGTYSWQNFTGVYLYMQDSINSYQITPQVGLGSVTILQVDYVGGRVKGSYSGQSLMDINNTGQTIPIVISGNFDVLRTQ